MAFSGDGDVALGDVALDGGDVALGDVELEAGHRAELEGCRTEAGHRR